MVKIGPQNFWVHFGSFLVYALLHLMTYAPRFCQIKDLIKKYICGNFPHYGISDCEVKIFLFDSASMKWSLCRGFWPLTPPIVV